MLDVWIAERRCYVIIQNWFHQALGARIILKPYLQNAEIIGLL